jgi:1-acyl-sn-glycerol-3-phosphate acyltransferase
MTLDAFRMRLLQTGGYESPVRPLRFAGVRRLPGVPSAHFYTVMLAAIVTCSFHAFRRRYDSAAFARASFRIMRGVEQCGGGLSLSGLDRMRGLCGPRVYVSNHMSGLETVVLPVILLTFGDVSIVVKKALLRYPFLGRVIAAGRPIVVERRSPRHDLAGVLTQGRELLAKGRSVIVFPQATRQVLFDPARFNTLGVRLAARAGVPLVPIAVKTDFMGIGKILRDAGRIDPAKRVRIRFGQPARAEGNPRAAHEAVVRFIAESLSEWGAPVARPARGNGTRKDSHEQHVG